MTKIKIELSENEWNVVVNAVAQRPFAEVAQVIALIQQQAQIQLAQLHAANTKES